MYNFNETTISRFGFVEYLLLKNKSLTISIIGIVKGNSIINRSNVKIFKFDSFEIAQHVQVY